MLTPVDIQQKKFKTGLGYNKDDVNSFFHEVSISYEELYRSNAELKERVITMEDSLQHYKSTEDNLKKSLLLAEKNSEESKTNAAREARNIEAEARSRANEIVKDAHEQLAEMETRMKELEIRYAEYKQRFTDLVGMQLSYLKENDFDPSAQVVDRRAGNSSQRGGGSGRFDIGGMDSGMSSGMGSSMGGGMGSGGLGTAASVGTSREQRRSSASNVYGSVLGGEGIDPFGGM